MTPDASSLQPGAIVSIVSREDGSVLDGMVRRYGGDPLSLATIRMPDGLEALRFPDQCILAGTARPFGLPALTHEEAEGIRARCVASLDEDLGIMRRERRPAQAPTIAAQFFAAPMKLTTPGRDSHLSPAMSRYICDHPRFEAALAELHDRHHHYWVIVADHLRPSSPPLKRIAADLGISYAAARQRKSRGMAVLRSRLADLDAGPPEGVTQ